MKKIAISSVKYVLRALLYGTVGASAILLALFVHLLNDKADLEVWHTAELDEEFTVDSDVSTFEAYLSLESRLFDQLEALVYEEGGTLEARRIDRYAHGSLSDPTAWETDWNRTFELSAESPKCGVLLLHGLSDSPYSLRSIGETLHEEGAHVVGLRIPGHGTAPSALTETTWQDMSAAVRLAVQHLKDTVGDQPLYLVGYSNGGALSVRYALESLEDSAFPRVDGMVLLSPEIGITSLARFVVWQERIGYLLRLNKLQWQSVLPEYDPYKYCSFPANAGMLAYELTVANRVELAQLSAQGGLADFPSVLAFQSVVDSTVTASALVHDLFVQLPAAEHELVAYDINRSAEIEPLLALGKVPDFIDLEADPLRAYTLTLITNKTVTSESVESRTYMPGVHDPEVDSLGMKWPASVYSLAHVALPFEEKDAIYGAGLRTDPTRIHLGAMAIRGEKGVLAISAADMLRQRWNPFYKYQEKRILEHFDMR